MINKKLEKILLKVQKPGKYVGGELNAVIKNKDEVDVRFAFCFPDTYEIGMSHLGMKILYSQFNSKPYIWCERVFAPWIDMEEQMIKNDIPLYALESKDPVSEFDFIGFTLQYELSYTNVLNMLKLSNVPLKSLDRKELKNIVVAGGPCACNPEPIAEFVDIFFIGDGEEVDLEVIELFRECKKNGKSKDEFLLLASQIKGVYVPALYDVAYNEDGTIKSFVPKYEEVPKKIEKRVMMDMDNSYYPDNFVVPNVEIVHDRAVEEIFRGCIRGCRFCQAGFLYRPVREKSIDCINEQCRTLCKNTGYDEISLSSLSSSDYSQIVPLLTKLSEWSTCDNVSLSLPSLRVDGFTEDILSKIKSVRKSGLTFAPEAGTQRLRDVINKNVKEDELLNTCSVAFDGGYTTVKLYFMIGLPTETMDDVKGIAELGRKVVDAFYQCENRPKGKSVKVTLSSSSFVPKPFTPFQWEPQDSIDTIHQKQAHIRENLTTKKISYNYHDADTSFMEAVFARGDRKLSAVLEKACEKGMRFDGWSDCFSLEKWLEVFNECGIDPHFYANRHRSFDEILPWDHIDYSVTKEFLISECKKAYENTTTPHCREKCSNCGAMKHKGGVCFEKRQSMV
ncbi:MAG: TIGR03960 family B12-binding radical SAM protein [Eubacteriales bacterium]|nr:TIGR03960 family B12-binding radical SAM protein [Eubacteriales bacterium]